MKRRDFIAASLASAGVTSGLFGSVNVLATAQEHAPEAGDTTASEFTLLAPPVLQWADEERVDVVALTNTPAACHVELREVGPDASAEVREIANQEDGLIRANETFHHIELTGLKPGRTYEYVLVAREIRKFEPYKVHWGAKVTAGPFRFVTPKCDADSVRFAVLNDLHKNTALIHQLFKSLEQCQPLPEFVMLNGDVLSHIQNETDIRAIYDLPGTYASTHPTIWVRGNHECRGQFARYMSRYLAKPDGQYYYTFRRGPVQLLVLDCGEDKPDDHWAYSGLNDFEEFRAKEEAWLDDVLASEAWKNAPWRVLVVHIPVEKGTLRAERGVEPYRERWTKKLEEAGLDLEISAHYHQVLFTDRSAKQGFPIVVGSGPDPKTAVAFHVNATAGKLEIEMVDVNGKVVEQRTWKH